MYLYESAGIVGLGVSISIEGGFNTDVGGYRIKNITPQRGWIHWLTNREEFMDSQQPPTRRMKDVEKVFLFFINIIIINVIHELWVGKVKSQMI